MILSDGDKWREQRRFVLSRFKDFGVGRSGIEKKAEVEVETMIEEIEADIVAGSDIVDVAKHIEYDHHSLSTPDR